MSRFLDQIALFVLDHPTATRVIMISAIVAVPVGIGTAIVLRSKKK